MYNITNLAPLYDAICLLCTRFSCYYLILMRSCSCFEAHYHSILWLLSHLHTICCVVILTVWNLSSCKKVLCIPTRFCLNKTGPGESNFIATAIRSSRGDSTINEHPEINISITLLKNLLYIDFSASLKSVYQK